MNTGHVTKHLKGTHTHKEFNLFPAEKQVGSKLTVSFCRMILPTKMLSATTVCAYTHFLMFVKNKFALQKD